MSFSINTNASALTALQALQQTQQALAQTQQQVSTGYAVNSAADNTGYFSIATQLRADNSIVSASNSALQQSQSVLTIASTAITSVLSTIGQIQSQLTAAKNPTASTTSTSINAALQGLGQQLTDAINGASFNGLNIVNGSQTSPLNFVAGYNASANGGAFNTITFTATALTGATAGTGILGAATATTTDATVYDFTQLGTGGNAVVAGAASGAGSADSISSALTAATTLITNYAAQIGSAQVRITAAQNFNTALQTNYSTGISALVDADLNQASTRLQALQTQQQLGIQSLSIANQNSQLILKLFP